MLSRGGSAGAAAAEDVAAEHPVASGTAVDGSVVPVGSVQASDGIDTGHIGMAVAGLGALGLTGAGTAGLVGRHRRQHRS